VVHLSIRPRCLSGRNSTTTMIQASKYSLYYQDFLRDESGSEKMSSALGLLVCMTYQGDSYHVVGSKLLEGSDPTSRNRMARVSKIPGSRQQVDLCEYFCLRRIDYRIRQMATYVAERQPVFMRPAAAQQFGTPEKITCTRP